MKLLIMRHGEAGWHQQDEQRELTDIGRVATDSVVRQIADSPWRPEEIWCSTLVRARQTAAIAAELLNCQVIEKPFLTPDDDPGLCLDALLEAGSGTRLLVSHMPLVGVLTSLLVDGQRQGAPFATSQALGLEMVVAGPGCAELRAQFLP